MHLSILIWSGGGRPGKGWEFDIGSWPVVGTFDYRQLPGVSTIEFHPTTDAILDWKL